MGATSRVELASSSGVPGIALVLAEPEGGGRSTEKGPATLAAGQDQLRGEVHSAATTGDARKLQQLLAADPALANVRDSHGRTPLHVALHTSTIEQLLLHGADPDLAKGREGAAAWHR